MTTKLSDFYLRKLIYLGTVYVEVTSTFTIPYGSRGLTEKLLYFSKEELLFLDTVWSDHLNPVSVSGT